MNSPWGEAHVNRVIFPGVHDIQTGGHGGLMFSLSYARDHLSRAAIKRGDRWGSFLCYEEDVAYLIPLYEIPALFPKADRDSTYRELCRWFPDYVQEYEASAPVRTMSACTVEQIQF